MILLAATIATVHMAAHLESSVGTGGPGKRKGSPTSLTVLLVVLLTCAGAILRFAGIADKSLWIDEAFSVWVSRQSFPDLWRTTVNLDFHPPLYYASLRVWLLAFGDAEASLRSLSAVVSVLTLPVVFLIGDRLGGRVLGVTSMALIAVSPLHIAYAQQARMYTLTTFCAALSLLSALALLDEPDRGRSSSTGGPLRAVECWGGFAVSTTLTMLTHNTAVLEWASIAVFVVTVLAWSLVQRARGHREEVPRIGSFHRPLWGVVGIATGLGAAALLWLPWLPYFLSQSRRVDEEFWLAAPTLSTVAGHWHDLTGAYAPPGAYRNYVLLGVLVLLVLGVGKLRSRPEVVLLLLLLVLVPVAIELLVSLRRPIFYAQTLIWTSVPFTVLLAAGILRLRSRPVIAFITGVVLVLNSVALRNYYQFTGKEEWRTAVQYLAERVRPEEMVLFSAAWAQIPFDYYYHKSAGPPIIRHGLPTDVTNTPVLEAKMTAADLPWLDELTAGRTTVWLVYSHDWYTDPQGMVPSRLAASFSARESRSFSGVTVAQYQTEPSVIVR